MSKSTSRSNPYSNNLQFSSHFSALDAKINRWKDAKEKAQKDMEKKNMGLEKRMDMLKHDGVADNWKNNLNTFTGNALINSPSQIPAGKPLTLGIKSPSSNSIQNPLQNESFAKTAKALLNSIDKYAESNAIISDIQKAVEDSNTRRLSKNYADKQSWISSLSGGIWPKLILSMTGLLRNDTDAKLQGDRYNPRLNPINVPGYTRFIGKTYDFPGSTIPVDYANI